MLFHQLLPLCLIRNHIGKPGTKKQFSAAGGLIAASAAKVLFLWVGLAIVALPLLGLPPKQSALMNVMFTWPQVVTSLVGSALAMGVVPLLGDDAAERGGGVGVVG